MTTPDPFLELWGALVMRISLSLAISGILVAIVVAVIKDLPARWRHGLWVLVVLQGLCWFQVPIKWERSAPVLPSKVSYTAATAQQVVIPISDSGRLAEDVDPNTLATPTPGATQRGRNENPSSHDIRIAAPSRVNFLAIAFAAWATGVAVLATILIAQLLRFHLAVLRSSRPASDDLIRKSAELARNNGIQRNVRVLQSPHCAVPMLVGVFRPTILLPTTFGKFEPSHQAVLLAHELGHWRRRDVVLAAASLAACVLNFFNPFIWWARSRLATAREECADRWATQAAAVPPTVAARALLAVAESMSDRRVVGLAAANSASQLRRRIERILNPEELRRASRWSAALVGTLLVVGTAASWITPREAVTAQPGEEDIAAAATGPVLHADLAKYPDLSRVVRVIGERPFLHEMQIFNMAFADCGRTLLTSSRSGLRAWDVAEQRLTKEISLDGPGPNYVFLSLDGTGTLLAIAGDFGDLGLIRWPTGETIRTLAEKRAFDGQFITSIALSPDGTRLAAAYTKRPAGTNEPQRGVIRIWNAREGELIATVDDALTRIYSIAWRPDSRILAAGQEVGTITVLDRDGKVQNVLTMDPTEELNELAFDRSGERLAAITLNGSTAVWNVEDGTPVWQKRGEFSDQSLVGGGTVAGLTFDPADERLFLTHSRIGFYIMDADTGEETFRTDRGVTGCSPVFSPSGHLVAVANDQFGVDLWDPDSLTLHTPDRLQGYAAARKVLATPNGRQLITLGERGLHFWESGSGELLGPVEFPSDSGGDISLSPDGQQLAAVRHKYGDVHSALALIDVRTREKLESFPLDGYAAKSIAFTPDGQHVAATGGATLQLVDVSSGERLWSKDVVDREKHWLEQIAISPDGSTLAAIVRAREETRRQPLSYSSRGSIHLFRISDGERIGELAGPGTPARIAFSPDGVTLIASVDRSATATLPQEEFPLLQLWDVVTLDPVTSMKRPNDRIMGGVLAPDWNMGAVWTSTSGVTNTELSLWELDSSRELMTLLLPGSVRDATLLPGGTRLVTANANGSVYVIQLD